MQKIIASNRPNLIPFILMNIEDFYPVFLYELVVLNITVCFVMMIH